jgi:hypothetical protein
MVDIDQVTKDIAALVDAQPSGLTEFQRVALLDATTRLRDTIRSPLEATLQHAFAVYETAVLKLAVDMQLFDITVATSTPLSVSDIANQLSSDSLLVGKRVSLLYITLL